MSQVSKALARLHDKILTHNAVEHFTVDFDPDWRSECEIDHVNDSIHWHPCSQPEPVDFAGLANAADSAIHPDIRAFYGAFWSGNLQLKSREGPVDLIQLWNQADFDRLIQITAKEIPPATDTLTTSRRAILHKILNGTKVPGQAGVIGWISHHLSDLYWHMSSFQPLS